MSGPRRAGALIYAKDLQRLSGFYQSVLGMVVRHVDAQHHVIESVDMQLIIHAMPPHIAATLPMADSPELRERQAIKLFFTVPSLLHAQASAEQRGGGVFGPRYAGPGFQVSNAFDCEGNILQLRVLEPLHTDPAAGTHAP